MLEQTFKITFFAVFVLSCLGLTVLIRKNYKTGLTVTLLLLLSILWRGFSKANSSRYYSIIVIWGVILSVYAINAILQEKRIKKNRGMVFLLIVAIISTAHFIKCFSGFKNVYIHDLQEIQKRLTADDKKDLIYIYNKEYRRIKNGNNSTNILEFDNYKPTFEDLLTQSNNNIQLSYCTYFIVPEYLDKREGRTDDTVSFDASASYSVFGQFISNSSHDKKIKVYKFYPSAYNKSSVAIDKDSLILLRSEFDKDTFDIIGKRTQIFSKKDFYISDKNISARIQVKNTGKVATQLYLGYVVYSQDRLRLNRCHYPYKGNNLILNVVSASKGRNIITLDNYPEWEKNCTVAIGAKGDLSDIPNSSLINGKIVEIQRLDNGYANIVLDRPLDRDLKPTDQLRIHGTPKTYIYTNRQLLLPDEEIVLSSNMHKDNKYKDFVSRAFFRDVYYVKPILLSYSQNPNEFNSIAIKDFRVELSDN